MVAADCSPVIFGLIGAFDYSCYLRIMPHPDNWKFSAWALSVLHHSEPEGFAAPHLWYCLRCTDKLLCSQQIGWFIWEPASFWIIIANTPWILYYDSQTASWALSKFIMLLDTHCELSTPHTGCTHEARRVGEGWEFEGVHPASAPQSSTLKTRCLILEPMLLTGNDAPFLSGNGPSLFLETEMKSPFPFYW